MRTTLTLDDEEFSYAQAYAQARAMKLGDAVSEIIRKMRKTTSLASVLMQAAFRPFLTVKSVQPLKAATKARGARTVAL